MIYAVTFAGLPVALWTGAMDEARRQVDLLVAHAAGNRRAEQWLVCFARVLKLREGNEREALIASFIEPRLDTAGAPPFADLAPDANIPVPMPGAEPVDVLWNTPELLRVDAELLLWHAAPGAVAAAEAKLLRALEIARVQSALSWELRAAMSLARLWRRHGRAAEARDLLAATYGKVHRGIRHQRPDPRAKHDCRPRSRYSLGLTLSCPPRRAAGTRWFDKPGRPLMVSIRRETRMVKSPPLCDRSRNPCLGSPDEATRD